MTHCTLRSLCSCVCGRWCHTLPPYRDSGRGSADKHCRPACGVSVVSVPSFVVVLILRCFNEVAGATLLCRRRRRFDCDCSGRVDVQCSVCALLFLAYRVVDAVVTSSAACIRRSWVVAGSLGLQCVLAWCTLLQQRRLMRSVACQCVPAWEAAGTYASLCVCLHDMDSRPLHGPVPIQEGA